MRSHHCGHVTAEQVGQDVVLCGWVHRRRDHGGVIFIDLRDRSGIVQVVVDPGTLEAFQAAERVRQALNRPLLEAQRMGLGDDDILRIVHDVLAEQEGSS